MPHRSAPQRGSLLAIGGHEVRGGADAAILRHFVDRSGGSAARLVVLSTASPKPEERTAEYRGAFHDLGVDHVSFFHQNHRDEADDPALLRAVDEADGVFFTGGNQLKLVTVLAGTILESTLRERHRSGLHLAGTSAGASAMSAVMIARGRARSAARLSSIRMSPGFGLLPRVIVDQHFRERDRFGRLIAAVLCNPSMLGFGLDEDTAFELDENDRASVIGSGSLTIVDGSELEGTNLDVVAADAPAAFAGLRVHVLTAGWSYDLRTGRIERPRIDPAQCEPVVQDEDRESPPRSGS